jgi:hypothetical protein
LRRPGSRLGCFASPATWSSITTGGILALLDETDRDVFLMREVGGLSYDEIGSACDLSPDAVRSRIYRSRLELRETLSADIALARKQPIRHSGRSI